MIYMLGLNGKYFGKTINKVLEQMKILWERRYFYDYLFFHLEGYNWKKVYNMDKKNI